MDSASQMSKRVTPLLLGDKYKNAFGYGLFYSKLGPDTNAKISLFCWHAGHGWVLLARALVSCQSHGCHLLCSPSFIHSALDRGLFVPKFASSLDLEVSVISVSHSDKHFMSI